MGSTMSACSASSSAALQSFTLVCIPSFWYLVSCTCLLARWDMLCLRSHNAFKTLTCLCLCKQTRQEVLGVKADVTRQQAVFRYCPLHSGHPFIGLV